MITSKKKIFIARQIARCQDVMVDSERKQLSSRWVFTVDSWNILVGKENKINFVERDDQACGLKVSGRK